MTIKPWLLRDRMENYLPSFSARIVCIWALLKPRPCIDCKTLQSVLWLGQSSFCSSLPRYPTILQPPHIFKLPILCDTGHTPNQYRLSVSCEGHYLTFSCIGEHLCCCFLLHYWFGVFLPRVKMVLFTSTIITSIVNNFRRIKFIRNEIYWVWRRDWNLFAYIQSLSGFF